MNNEKQDKYLNLKTRNFVIMTHKYFDEIMEESEQFEFTYKQKIESIILLLENAVSSFFLALLMNKEIDDIERNVRNFCEKVIINIGKTEATLKNKLQ